METGNQSQDFRFFLQNQLVDRCRKNPNYSLRSFARSLGVEASALSRILRGKRAVSPRMFRRLADKMGMDPAERRQFRQAGPAARSEYSQLSVDAFRVISDWYHFAILELVSVTEFRSDEKWIAKALGITQSEVHIALERLQRLGLLALDEKGRITGTTGNNTTTRFPGSTQAHRKLQKEILKKAMEALDGVPVEERDQSSMTMAVDTDRLAQAKAKISNFRREMAELLEGSNRKNEVYQLTIALFPVTQLNKGEKA